MHTLLASCLVLGGKGLLRRRPSGRNRLARRPQRRPPPRRPSLMITDQHRQPIDDQRADVRRLAVEDEDPISTFDDEGPPREVVVQLLTPYQLDVAQRQAAPFSIFGKVPLEDGFVPELL